MLSDELAEVEDSFAPIAKNIPEECEKEEREEEGEEEEAPFHVLVDLILFLVRV